MTTEYKEGECVMVAWGRFGTVKAKVHHVSVNGIVYCQRRAHWGWTKPRRIYISPFEEEYSDIHWFPNDRRIFNDKP